MTSSLHLSLHIGRNLNRLKVMIQMMILKTENILRKKILFQSQQFKLKIFLK
jgi:hypothetical protein